MKVLLGSICWLVAVAAGSASCGGELAPANQAQPGKSQSRPVTDYGSLLDRLRAGGAIVEPEGEAEQPFLSVTGTMIKLDGEDVQVFQYPDAAAVEAQAARVSRDGSAVGTTKPHWIGPPHFYKRGRVLVLYVGDEEKVLKALEAALGRQFAGK